MSQQIRTWARFAAMSIAAFAAVNVAGVAMAAPPAGAPEIDPSSAASALAVLAGGGLIVRERIRCWRNK